jgi:hypothetical protein
VHVENAWSRPRSTLALFFRGLTRHTTAVSSADELVDDRRGDVEEAEAEAEEDKARAGKSPRMAGPDTQRTEARQDPREGKRPPDPEGGCQNLGPPVCRAPGSSWHPRWHRDSICSHPRQRRRRPSICSCSRPTRVTTPAADVAYEHEHTKPFISHPPCSSNGIHLSSSQISPGRCPTRISQYLRGIAPRVGKRTRPRRNDGRSEHRGCAGPTQCGGACLKLRIR